MKKNDILCTILCPVYNKSQYLQRCFDSILMQKTKYKYKVIIIDDKSTDNSVSIIQNYVKKYPNIFELHKNVKNLGLSRTSLKLYELIETPFYCVLDPDDFWVDKSHLDQAVSFLLSHKNYTMYGTNTWIIDNKNNKKQLNAYGFETKTFDLKKDGFIYSHTSSTFFVNTFTKNELQKLSKYINTKNTRCFEGETYRNMVALDSGLAYINNKCMAVYNFDEKGVWSSMNNFNANMLNANLFFDAYAYFDYKYKTYLYTAKYYLDICIKEIQDPFANTQVVSLYDSFLKLINKQNLSDDFGYIKNIVFLLPSRIFGGYETCFIRLAEYLSEHFGFNIFYVDYKDGIAPEYLKKTSVSIIKYDDGCTVNLPNDAFVFAPITWAYQMLFHIRNSDNVKFGFWWAHPSSYKWLKTRSGLSSSIILKFFKHALRENSMFFMDFECEKSCDRLINYKKHKPYLPVFIDKIDKKTKTKLIKEDEINIAWVGRLDSDKIYSLLNILHNFEQYKTDKKKRIHVIGIGDSENLIDESIYPSIEIIKTGKLVYQDLDKYLLKNIDVLFGMGTSLLEGAKFGIPSVLVRISTKNFYEDKYINLFDLNKYILGYEDLKTVKKLKKNTMSYILNNIISNKSKYTDLNFDYVNKNHSIQSSACRFVHNIKYSDFKYMKYINILNKNNTVKKRFKIFFYSFLLALAQIPVLDLLQRSKQRLKLKKKIDKWWR